MATFTVKASMTGIKSVKSLSTKIKKANKKTILGFAKWHQQDTRRRISITKTDPHGRHWAPWTFSTSRERHRRGTTGGGLLFESGALWRSIKYNIRGNKMEFGSTEEYAQYLQDGRNSPTFMRPRQIVNLNTRRSKIVYRKLFKRNMR